jgi:NAD(P)-dependent dehydrogenase (short-subunit alcohol dehydrogenase family)
MAMLDGKVAIVTGAGRGIGRGEALDLALEGASVVVNDLGTSSTGDGSSMALADEVVEVIKTRGGTAIANYEDVGDFDGARRLINTAIERFGRLDVLVNNAGILRDATLDVMSEAEYDTVVRVHQKGTFNTMRHASAYWRSQVEQGRRQRASIVNTVSAAGLEGNAGQINYGAAKAAIAAMTVIASLELAPLGVRCNAVSPGGMTRMVTEFLAGPGGVAARALGVDLGSAVIKNPEDYDTYHPLNPGNSAPMVVWLASDESLHVTGQVFRAEGNRIGRYVPWQRGTTIERDGKWSPSEIGPAINDRIFQSRNPGMIL